MILFKGNLERLSLHESATFPVPLSSLLIKQVAMCLNMSLNSEDRSLGKYAKRI